MKPPQTYHLAIDWRRAKFFTSNPDVMPDIADAVAVPEYSLFLPCARLTDVIVIRDWLHASALHYRLLGCYERLTSFFQGIVFVFFNLTDLFLFRRQWEPQDSEANLPLSSTDGTHG
jgi:hypothetical protein